MGVPVLGKLEDRRRVSSETPPKLLIVQSQGALRIWPVSSYHHLMFCEHVMRPMLSNCDFVLLITVGEQLSICNSLDWLFGSK